jgi:tetratricopeptide (TPR) repeat protein
VAYGARDRDYRRGLKILTGILVAAAIATLSRGATLALAAGGLTFFAFRPRLEDGETRGGKTYAMFLLGALFIAGVTLAFKGEDIIPELLGTTGAKEVKLQVWRDALAIFQAHPMGIGFGAFSRVYPVYRTIIAPVRFEFAENQFLSFLLEGGIPGLVLLLVALILTLRLFLRHRRSDSVEAALLAALAAVLVHNTVDFGLEVPGVLYPFLAILGTLFGRLSFPAQVADAPTTSAEGAKPPRVWPKVFVPIVAIVSVPTSLYLLSRPIQRDFNALLKQTSESKIALLEAASQAHPTDYYYAFWRAMLEPNRTIVGAQIRLRWLNRAMILCPTCMDTHWETARLLWRIGKKNQALGEYRLIARHAKENLFPVIYELFKTGAPREQLESFSTDDNRLSLANYFIDLGLLPSAHVLLDREADLPIVEDTVIRAKLALAENHLDIAQQQATKALELAPQDPRPALIAAECAIRTNEPDRALTILRASLRLNPLHVDLTRKLLAILQTTDQFETIEHTISDLRSALVQAGIPTFEANLASANLYMRRGIYRKAISEYQAALAQQPDNIGLRLALAHAAEQSGNISIAQDAYHEVLRRDPQNPQARTALSRTTRDKKLLDAILQQSPEKTLEELR